MNLRRRDVLKAIVGTPTLLSFSPLVPGLLHRAVASVDSPKDERETVLVVLQLTGGNDGLNTVVPFQDDAYGRSRSTLRLTAREVLEIDDDLGLHPRMDAMWRMVQDGALAIVQGVGYPQSSRDHEQALRDWQTAKPEQPECQTGWGGRAVDWAVTERSISLPAAFVGSIAIPQVLNAERSIVPCLRRVQQLQLQKPTGGSFEEQDDQPRKAPANESGRTSGNPLLDDVRRQSAAAYAGSRKVERVLRDGGSIADYPPMLLAKQLAAVAQLIRADLGIRMFFVELGGGGFGGFDNHAGQKENHAALLGQMSQSVAAFFADLQQHGAGERVLLATCSEFGRTLSENGRRGTGHGEAAPVFVAGSQVNGGLIGRHPSLTDLAQDAPKYHTDFRRVYATLLEKWLGFDSRIVFGRDFEPISKLLVSH